MRCSLTLLRCLIVRDCQLFLSDRRAAILCFLIPILLGSLFGIVFDNPARKMGKVRLPLLIVSEDDHPFTSGLIEELLKSDHLNAKLVDRQQAERDLEKRRFGVALLLPAEFGSQSVKKLGRSRPAVQLLHHPLSAMESEWAEGILTEILLKRLAREYLEPMGLALLPSMERPFDLTRQTVPASTSASFNSYSHSFAGMMLQYLLFWGMESGLLFLRERQRGIWNRIRIAPVPIGITLMSRVLSTGLIGLVQIALTFLFAWVVFGVEITGSWLGFAPLAISVSLFAAVSGLLVATMSGTEARARNVCILFILVLSMLGGLWLPTFLLPPWVQDLSLSLPTTWAMQGLDGVTWMGSGLGRILPCVGAVLGFTAVATGIAWLRFSRMERLSRRGGNA